MKFNHPTIEQVPQLWSLWQEAFGDEDEYLEIFYNKAFSVDRCMLTTDETGKALAALYWFDCRVGEEKLAYIFGVAVANAVRGNGYCRALMGATLDRLTQLGYKGAMLVPANQSLYAMYAKLGFEKFGGVSETVYSASKTPAQLRRLGEEEYTLLRNRHLPQGAVVQEGENIAFLAARTELYAGDDFVFSFVHGMGEFVVEFLGNMKKAPDVVCALGREKLMFRTVGNGRDFAVYHSLSEEGTPPKYFGIPFDF